jgi:O-antigen ligase
MNLNSWNLEKQISFKAFFLGLHAATIPFNRTLSIVLLGIYGLLWLKDASFRVKFEMLKRHALVLLPTLVFCLYGLSLLYSTEKDFFILEKRAFLFIVPILIASTSITQKQSIVILKLFILGCSLLTILSIIQAIRFYSLPTEHFTLEHLPHQLSSLFHAPYYSLFLVLSNYFILFISYQRQKALGWKILLIIFFSLFILVLSSRTALACNIILLLSYSYFQISSKYRAKVLFAALAGLISMLFIAFQYYPHFQKRLTGVSEVGNGISERLTVYKASAEVIYTNIFLGVGVGDVETEMHKIFDQWNLPEDFYELNPHNEYLYTWASTGLVGLCVFLFMLLYPVWLSFKKAKYIYAAFYIIFAFGFMTEVLLSRFWGVACFSLFYSIFTLELVVAVNPPATTEKNISMA